VSVRTWDELKAWLGEKAPPRTRRSYPLPPERRRLLPERPGVYRFLRCNGDILYVGKATNLKKRVASHFTQGSRSTERALEMLTQVHALEITAASTVLEAALLETDEIKRLAPPYNVQLLEGERRAWFTTPDLRDAVPEPDGIHPLGPLPSRWALTSLAAIRVLASGGGMRCCGPRSAWRSRGCWTTAAATPRRMSGTCPACAATSIAPCCAGGSWSGAPAGWCCSPTPASPSASRARIAFACWSSTAA
jgi:predicted GIY-YIG superfamily endonuclease